MSPDRRDAGRSPPAAAAAPPHGQFPRAAEQAVQDQSPPDVPVQAVFRGEPHPAQHLLAVPGLGPVPVSPDSSMTGIPVRKQA